MGNVLTTLRLSLGDFDFGPLEGKGVDKKMNWLFWIIWLMMVIFSALIFLNFFIAEMTTYFETVKEDIGSLVYKERALLVAEAEIFMSLTSRFDTVKFPKYIVVREKQV